MTPSTLDSMLASVADSFDTKALQALVDMRASRETEERLEYLGGQANEGLLTEEERQEYKTAISFGNFLGLLQSKARKKLQDAA